MDKDYPAKTSTQCVDILGTECEVEGSCELSPEVELIARASYRLGATEYAVQATDNELQPNKKSQS